MADISIDRIWYALNSLERASGWLSRITVGIDARDLIRGYEADLRHARQEYEALSRAMPDFRSYMANKAVEYDRYVTRLREPEPDCCSCHINPPCGFCTRQTDEDEDARTEQSA